MAIPGVPPVGTGFIVNAVTLIAGDIISTILGLLRPPWGLYKDGVPVVIADNVVSFDFRRDWVISDYPIEQGSFESYNKVETPFGTRLRFSAGGDVVTRQQLIDSLNAAGESLDLFDAVTPERIYESVSVAHEDYRRTAVQGAGLLVVDVWCTQVRQNTAPTFTKSASSAPQINGGTVQPQAASQTQIQKVAGIGSA